MLKKIKSYFFKENYVYLALLSLFYLLWGVVSLFCDSNNSLIGGFRSIYANIYRLFRIPYLNVNTATWVISLFLMLLLYIFFAVFGMYMIKKFLVDKDKPSYKAYLIYGGIFVVFSLLPVLLSVFRNMPFNDACLAYVTFSGSSFLMTLITLIFVIPIVLIIYLVIYVLVRYVFTKKRFTSKEVSVIRNDNGSNELDSEEVTNEIFVGLKNVDNEFATELFINDDESLTLKDIATRFRNYLAKTHELYFSETMIRSFISSFGASRLIILEGLSGTGKSSLPRYFAEFINEEAFFAPVQATWRDRTSLLGYYNDFSKTFKETDFLVRLYSASYSPKHLNIMVLDELNLSRIEYYFADFLSILEYPSNEWKLTLMHLPEKYVAPVHLSHGVLNIPENTYFVGTANKDDSTYLITDKVYDRAMVLDFEDRNEPFEVVGDANPINLSFDRFTTLLNEAKENDEYKFTKEDYDKFYKICEFTYDTFDITFGNRIMNQIKDFVPCFIATGGSKNEALDLMFAKKILRKLEGHYESYIYNGLIKLESLINKVYGKGEFKVTERAINNLLKKVK